MIRSYSSLLFWLGMTILASLLLYHTSDRVNALGRQLHEIDAQIDGEQESLHVLRAEWVYLSNPARIQAEAQHFSDLQPTAPRHVTALRNMADLLPIKGGLTPPTAVAEADAPTATPTKAESPRAGGDRVHVRQAASTRQVFAALNAGRLNDHMIMQHNAAKADSAALTLASAKTDSIGALINTLGLNP